MLFAYLDPGTGSLVFQLGLAGLLGGLFSLKSFWNALKAKVAGKPSND